MDLLTRREAAKRLKIGLRTLDRRIAEGDLKCYRLGDGPRAPVRISEEQLREYLEKNNSAISPDDHARAEAILAKRNCA